MKLLAENQTGAPQSQADPFALLENGRYYIYATGRSGVHLYESDTLGDFTYSGICYSRDGGTTTGRRPSSNSAKNSICIIPQSRRIRTTRMLRRWPSLRRTAPPVRSHT